MGHDMTGSPIGNKLTQHAGFHDVAFHGSDHSPVRHTGIAL